MDQHSEPKTFVPDASIAIGQLIVKLRDAGLFTNEDIRTVLRTALASAAPAISAAVPERGFAAAALRQRSLAAE